MRALIQRVLRASVAVDGKLVSEMHAIRTKLGLGSRAQVAAWAVGQVDVSV